MLSNLLKPSVLLLGRKAYVYGSGTDSRMFTAALFTVVQNWGKNPKDFQYSNRLKKKKTLRNIG